MVTLWPISRKTCSTWLVPECLQSLAEDAGFEAVQSQYVHRDTVNKKEGLRVPRIFVQAKFVRPPPTASLDSPSRQKTPPHTASLESPSRQRTPPPNPSRQRTSPPSSSRQRTPPQVHGDVVKASSSGCGAGPCGDQAPHASPVCDDDGSNGCRTCGGLGPALCDWDSACGGVSGDLSPTS